MPSLAVNLNGVSEVLFTLRIFGRNNKPRHYLPQHVWQDFGKLDSLGFHRFRLVCYGVIFASKGIPVIYTEREM